MARNPKDVIVSYYHYHRLLEFHHYTGNLENFAEYFMTDKGLSTSNNHNVHALIICLHAELAIFGKDSLQFSVLSSFAGRLEQTASSQFAFCLLRGP